MQNSPTTIGGIQATMTTTVEHIPYQAIRAEAGSSLSGVPTRPEGQSLRLEIDPTRLPPTDESA